MGEEWVAPGTTSVGYGYERQESNRWAKDGFHLEQRASEGLQHLHTRLSAKPLYRWDFRPAPLRIGSLRC
jgi:hypothetical protein